MKIKNILTFLAIILVVTLSPGYVSAAATTKGVCVVGEIVDGEYTESARYYDHISKNKCFEIGGCFSGRNIWGTQFTQCAGGPKAFIFGM